MQFSAGERISRSDRHEKESHYSNDVCESPTVDPVALRRLRSFSCKFCSNSRKIVTRRVSPFKESKGREGKKKRRIFCLSSRNGLEVHQSHPSKKRQDRLQRRQDRLIETRNEPFESRAIQRPPVNMRRVDRRPYDGTSAAISDASAAISDSSAAISDSSDASNRKERPLNRSPSRGLPRKRKLRENEAEIPESLSRISSPVRPPAFSICNRTES